MFPNSDACRCRRCSRDLRPSGDSVFESQESLAVCFRAGYGSVFGDGNIVSSFLCQHCVRELLGPWLHIQQDDPFHPKCSLDWPNSGCRPR